MLQLLISELISIAMMASSFDLATVITATEGRWRNTVEGIKNVVPTPIYVATNTTLDTRNADSFLDTMGSPQELGEAFACNGLIRSGGAPSIAEEFALSVDAPKELLPRTRDKARELGMKFMWYTPTQHCQLDPVRLGPGVKPCFAARVNVCVGPDGEVFPRGKLFLPVARAGHLGGGCSD